MKKLYLAVISLTLLMFISTSWAKRAEPKQVTPVENEKYYITAPCCYMGGIKVYEPKTRKFLWKMRVYNIQFCEEMEGDVQDVHIKKIELKDDTLKVVNEEGYEYEVDLRAKTSRAKKGSLVVKPYLRNDGTCTTLTKPIKVYDSEYSTCDDCDSKSDKKSKDSDKK